MPIGKTVQPALLARHALYAIGATLVFVVGILLGRRVGATTPLDSRNPLQGQNPRCRDPVIPDYSGGATVARFLTGLENLFWVTALADGGYLCLHFVLSLFPWTRGLASNLFSMLVKPLETMVVGMLRVIPDLLFLVILALVTRYVLTLIRLFFGCHRKWNNHAARIRSRVGKTHLSAGASRCRSPARWSWLTRTYQAPNRRRSKECPCSSVSWCLWDQRR